MGSTLYSLLTFVIFALDIWAIIQVVRSNAETLKKVLWVALIAFLPVLGLIVWALAGPRGNARL
ncbi:MAG TPA: PLD nuclease N-terminal domain-containing protein [Pseudomonas sp.]|nr:PLD nuclease N-terminal domain-containing protein [Pseudomonas sp.]